MSPLRESTGPQKSFCRCYPGGGHIGRFEWGLRPFVFAFERLRDLMHPQLRI